MSDNTIQLTKEQVANLQELLTVDSTIAQLIELVNDPEVNFQKIVDVVEHDPVITTAILRLVNSAAFGLPRRIETVAHAIKMLGLRQLRALVLSFSVMRTTSKVEPQIWLHSYSTSVLMSGLIDTNNLPVERDIVLTSLLHDIGRVAMRQLDQSLYIELNQKAEQEKLPINEAEIQHFGVSHDTVSDWLLEAWNLPDSIRTPVAYHHHDEPPDELQVETALLQVVDYVDLKARELPCKDPSSELMEAVGIQQEAFDELHEYQKMKYPELDESGIIGWPSDDGGATKRMQNLEKANTMFPKFQEEKDSKTS